MNKTFYRKILNGFLLFLILSFMSLITPAMVYIDLNILNKSMQDFSFTEISQTFFLVLSIYFYFQVSIKLKDQRGFYLLVSGLFACMFIREQDAYFDMFSHGSWVYPAILTAIFTIGYVFRRCRDSVILPMANYVGSPSYYILVISMVIILVFSRVFGSGNLIWQPAMGEAYLPVYKNVVQEGLELFGYVLLMLSGFMLTKQDTDSKKG